MRRIVIGMAVVVGVGLTAVLPAASASAALTAGSIVCTVDVQYPHGSSHVSGTINEVSTVLCNEAVPRLSQTTTLHKSGGGSWKGTLKVGYDTKLVQSNRATSCSEAPGKFYGSAVTDVTWPVGYVGPTHNSLTGKTVSVTCSSASVAVKVPAGSNIKATTSGYSYTISATHR